jgi:ankyrin repeat protein
MIFFSDQVGATILHHAALNGNKDLAEELLEDVVALRNIPDKVCNYR